jgi:hypothetical protein
MKRLERLSSYIVFALSAGIIGAVVTAIWEMARRDFSADDFTKAGVYFTAVTIGLVGVQILIAWRQTGIAERQTEILQREDARLRRTEDLILTFGGDGSTNDAAFLDTWEGRMGDSTPRRIPIIILNKGKSTRGVIVHIYVPRYADETTPRFHITDLSWHEGEATIRYDAAGRQFTQVQYAREFADTMLPGDLHQVILRPLQVVVPSENATYQLEYRLLSENGFFPRSGNQTLEYQTNVT